MDFETEPLYPACPTITRIVSVGGRTKAELLEALERNAIALNESAERLFASDQFTTATTRSTVPTVELTVRDLGFPRGATRRQAVPSPSRRSSSRTMTPFRKGSICAASRACSGCVATVLDLRTSGSRMIISSFVRHEGPAFAV